MRLNTTMSLVGNSPTSHGEKASIRGCL